MKPTLLLRVQLLPESGPNLLSKLWPIPVGRQVDGEGPSSHNWVAENGQ